MSASMLRGGSALGTIFCLLSFSAAAQAQWYPYGAPCCESPVPVLQTVYHTAPVTEYHAEKQTVQEPVFETAWKDESYTAYKPVVEQRTAEVPTVSYHNVVENRTMTVPAGHWQTYYRPNPRMSACQYDNRPGLLPELNRIGYRIRTAFTPPYSTYRQYVSTPIVQNVPVMRQVAVPGTRKVTYNVARYVPYQATRKVAVQTVRYVKREVTALRPVTVMRTYPVGTRTSYVYPSLSTAAPRTVLLPSPDPISRRAEADRPDAERTADSADDVFAPKKKKSDDDGLGAVDKGAARSVDVAIELAKRSGWKMRTPGQSGPTLIDPALMVAESKR